jgi:signal transduction histidine kinase
MMAYHTARRIDPNRAPRNYEYKLIDKHGTVKEVFATLAVIPGTKKSVGSFLDITRAKELEYLLRIQDKMTSLGRVAAGIAHEIRNPLSGINIYLNTLEKIYDRAESLDKVKQILGQIQSASSKIESVIKRVIDFSKPSEPKLVLTDINQPIEEAINLSSVTLRKSGIKIEKILANDLPLCHVDPLLIEEVILNLVANATEAMKNMDGVKIIKVTSSMKKNSILMRVSDSGPGVNSGLKDKIFVTTQVK